ncbi:hypothetical protein AX15_001193 [Amanita polypyramis BW_CC]|nr:hypothetical protein AX15_001193 [Amanita polypyramis BW_CC]
MIWITLFTSWQPFISFHLFFASSADGLASHMCSKVRMVSHPPMPSPVVSSQGVPPPLHGQSTTVDKPIGHAYVVDNTVPCLELNTYLKSEPLPSQFRNPDPALPVLKTFVPVDIPNRDAEYYSMLEDSFVGPSQDEIEEHQVFITNIYQIIEWKLESENNVFLASDAVVEEEKWSPLALDANIPAAAIIDQEWA